MLENKAVSNMDVCADSALFYDELNRHKQSKTSKSRKTTLFIDDDFYDLTKKWLTVTVNQRKQFEIDQVRKTKITLNKLSFTEEEHIMNSALKHVIQNFM